MKFPNSGSTSWTVIESIFKHGPMSVEKGLAKHGVLDGYPSHTRTIYERCVRAGWLVEVDGIHSLSPKMTDRMLERHAAKVQTPEIVPPRTPSEFKPLSDKNKFWLGLRREPLREVSFINGGCEYRQLGELA